MVTSGDQLKILVGEQLLNDNGSGGSFLTDLFNNPLMIAGGGAVLTDSLNKMGSQGFLVLLVQLDAGSLENKIKITVLTKSRRFRRGKKCKLIRRN